MKEHTETRGDRIPTRPGAPDEGRLQRHIDDVADESSSWQPIEVEIEGRLTGHAERGGVDKKIGLRDLVLDIVPGCDPDRAAEMVGQILGSLAAAIDHDNLTGTTIEKRADDGARRTTGSEENDPLGLCRPSRRHSTKIGK